MAGVTTGRCGRCGGPYIGPRNDLTCLNCGAQPPIAQERATELRAEVEALGMLTVRRRRGGSHGYLRHGTLRAFVDGCRCPSCVIGWRRGGAA